MVSYNTKLERFPKWFILLGLITACVAGCDKNARKASYLDTEMISAHRLLSAKDVDKFHPGRSMNDILKDIQWRGNFEIGCEYKGKNAYAISYDLFSEGPKSDGGEIIWAIFVDDKFVKFVSYPDLEMETIDYEGTPWEGVKPIKTGDYSALIMGIENNPLNIAVLEKEWRASETPQQIDPGLTIAFLLLRSGADDASEDDYKRNAELRDQYNAARIRIGMTESDVETILKGKPIESGELKSKFYRIYGSRESFNIVFSLHFSNILVVFQDGKVTGIYSGDMISYLENLNNFKEIRPSDN